MTDIPPPMSITKNQSFSRAMMAKSPKKVCGACMRRRAKLVKFLKSLKGKKHG